MKHEEWLKARKKHYDRGLDILNVAYHYMNLAPKGRDEGDDGGAGAWVRRRDEYQD